jgi:prevent-host-death family protein
MATIEVGIRELQRHTSDTLARIEDENCGVIVTRQGQPVAVLLPISQARPWVLLYRPSAADDLLADESLWPIEDAVRVAPATAERLDALPEQTRRRLMTRLRKLRGIDGTGRIAIRAGAWWALVDLSGGAAVPTLLQITRRAEIDRWLAAPDLSVQPM